MQELEKRFLLYMDILGTKVGVGDEHKNANLIKLVKSFTLSNSRFKIAYQETIDDPQIKYYVTNVKPEVSNFSDHISISFPATYNKLPYANVESSIRTFIPHLIMISNKMHKNSLKTGLLMRGAVTEGILLHEGASVIGNALNDAVYLEERIATYPRVVIPDKIIQLMRMSNLEPQCYSLRRDFDGVYFIDYMKYHVVNGSKETILKLLYIFRQVIEDNIKEDETCSGRDFSKLIKWRWLANKFDEAFDYFYHKNKDPHNNKNHILYKRDQVNVYLNFFFAFDYPKIAELLKFGSCTFLDLWPAPPRRSFMCAVNTTGLPPAVTSNLYPCSSNHFICILRNL